MEAQEIKASRSSLVAGIEMDTVLEHSVRGKEKLRGEGSLRACLAGLRLFQKQLRLWLLRWSGFSSGVGAVLENVWQNSFTCLIDV